VMERLMDMTRKLLILALATAIASPVAAQDKPTAIVLESRTGNVMAATGTSDSYQTAESGKQLAAGDSLMLSDGAKATVVYYFDNGDRKCTEQYVGPNTYVIDDECTKAVMVASGNGLRNAGVIVAGVALLAAVSGDDEQRPVPPPPPPPISP